MATATAPEELARDLMTPDPVCLAPTTTLREAAEAMRARDVGDVLLVDEERHLSGIVTDRDLVVRCLAGGLDPDITPISAAASVADVRSVTPDTPAEEVMDLMRVNAIRRLPVCVSGQPIGIISLGDLAVDQDPTSVLGMISDAMPNR
jgi:CBS domain-containing protein